MTLTADTLTDGIAVCNLSNGLDPRPKAATRVNAGDTLNGTLCAASSSGGRKRRD